MSWPLGPASVRRPTMSENSTSATAALIAAFFRMNPGLSTEEGGCGLDVDAFTRLHFFDFGPAQQAGRKEDQDDDQDREGCDILVFDREISRPQGFDEAD